MQHHKTQQSLSIRDDAAIVAAVASAEVPIVLLQIWLCPHA